MGLSTNSQDSIDLENAMAVSDIAEANNLLKKLESITKTLPNKKTTRNSNLDPNVTEICKCLTEMSCFVKVQMDLICL